jgi:NitT/TauT family transport system permease protein
VVRRVVFGTPTVKIPVASLSVLARRALPSRWDLLAALLIFGLLVGLATASREVGQPLSALAAHPISLEPAHLPQYAARTALRMLAAMVLSLLFTFTYATWAAKSRRAEILLIPLLDILQSVPILGFISVTVVFFMALAPGRILGAEFAAIFAIFTSQAWNMAFSFYQSLRTVPVELKEAAANFGLSPWMRFWRLEVPFAMPPLIWNMMMSMSGGWFFVVASESLSVGHTSVALPGIGSYIALAIERRSLAAVGWAIGTMLIVILLYDQLLFRPLVAWADRFRLDQQAGAAPARSWVLTTLRRSRLVAWIVWPFRAAADLWHRSLPTRPRRRLRASPADHGRWADIAWSVLVAVLALAALGVAGAFVARGVSIGEAGHAILAGLATMVRVFVLIALATVVWVPVGVTVGLRPGLARLIQPAAQFLAAFPANLLFPLVVAAIARLHLSPNVWLSPLMVLGTQWYILFNVIAGASALPAELRDAARNLRIGGWLWWRKVALPAVLPYYVTGAITASGGSWNASIVAESVSWGATSLTAFGLGSYIAAATAVGDFHRIVLGIAVMSAFVVIINRAFWRPLYRYAELKYRLT